jgi:hypothetical protein
VLPETLAGALLLGWLVAVMRARSAAGDAAAGALAGAAYLARPEAVLLVPIGLVWEARRRRPLALAAYVAAAGIVMLPALLALHARSGRWQLTPREARIAARLGPEAGSLLEAARVDPAGLARTFVTGAARQVVYDAKALGVLVVPFIVGAGVTPLAGPAVLPLATAAAFTALPLALNPSPRYAVPLVPLLVPWVSTGLLRLGAALGPWARPAAGILAVGLVAQGLWVSHPFDQRCWQEVSGLLRERYPGEPLVAVDGRFAYGAGARPLVPRSTRPDEALALAKRRGGRLWLTRPAWIGGRWQPPSEVREVARPCGGTFVLFELPNRG